jgi:hypothetical protein
VNTNSLLHRTLAGTAAVAFGVLAAQHPTASAKTAQRGFSVSAVVKPAATIALSTNALTWTAKNTLVRITFGTSYVPNGSAGTSAAPPGNKTYVPADNGPITITGSIRTSPGGGAGSIVVLAPGDIAGSSHANHVVPINDFAMTCSGGGNTGTQPRYAAALTPLHANALSPCATWGPAANARLNFSLNMLLILNGMPPDTYTSGGFTVVATTT